MATFLIHDITILDLATRTQHRCDLLIADGKVQKIGGANSLQTDGNTMDGTGWYASCGWLDAHAHLYANGNTIGVDGNAMLPDGVTLALDAGTSGPGNFEEFRLHTMKTAAIRELAYLNLAYMGLDRRFGELRDLSTVVPEKCRDVILAHPDEILGLKLRIDPRVCSDPEAALAMASRISQETGKPFVVHPSRCELPIEKILSKMKAGDIYAHSFANKAPGILDAQGKIKQAVLDARARGVQFDLSHGSGNFSFAVAKQALAQGFLPDAISTDLHTGSKAKVQSLALVMSKMLACGLDFWTVLDLVTRKAAAMVGIPYDSRTIVEGSPANLTLFRVEKGQFEFVDSDNISCSGNCLIQPVGSVLGDAFYRHPDAQ